MFDEPYQTAKDAYSAAADRVGAVRDRVTAPLRWHNERLKEGENEPDPERIAETRENIGRYTMPMGGISAAMDERERERREQNELLVGPDELDEADLEADTYS